MWQHLAEASIFMELYGKSLSFKTCSGAIQPCQVAFLAHKHSDAAVMAVADSASAVATGGWTHPEELLPYGAADADYGDRRAVRGLHGERLKGGTPPG